MKSGNNRKIVQYESNPDYMTRSQEGLNTAYLRIYAMPGRLIHLTAAKNPSSRMQKCGTTLNGV